jgi:hypothetical protein
MNFPDTVRVSGDECASVAVSGFDDCKVTVVERRDRVEGVAFSDSDDRGVNEPEPETGVGADQRDGALVIDGDEIDDREPRRCH